MKSIYTLIVLSIISLSSFVFAQEDSTKTNEEWKWHWDESENWNWKWGWDDDFDFGFSKSRPAISLNYGFGQINRNGINKDFVKPNLVELKLGYIMSYPAKRGHK